MMFPLERSIHNRPEYVKDRAIFGDWEGDLMIFRREHGNANVASLVERKTRYAVLFRNNDRRIEFSGWRKLKPGICTEAWFCDQQAPWQKGSVENLNKRAR
jgi:IS30 family transposase